MKLPPFFTCSHRVHAKACRCSFCEVKRVWPDREKVLAITRPKCEGHEQPCPCVLCQVEVEIQKEMPIWEAK